MIGCGWGGTSEGTPTLSFANDSVWPVAVKRFSTSAVAVIVATAIAAIVAARTLDGGSVVKRIANTSKVRMAGPTTAIVSRTTATASFKPA